MGPLPPYRPVKTHPEKDLVDALRYLDDNIQGMVGRGVGEKWQRVAGSDVRELRAVPETDRDGWQARQAEKWRQIVEGM